MKELEGCAHELGLDVLVEVHNAPELEKALELNPNLYQAHANYGKVLFDLKRYLESLQYYDNVIKLKPDFAEPWSNKGVVLNELKRFDEAIVYYNKAISLRPDCYKPWFNKGNTLFELRRYTEALSSYDRAIELKSDNAEIWFNKGNACFHLNRFEESLTFYDNALSLKPDYAEGWSNRANALNELKRYDEAISHYDQALILKPDYAEGLSNKGLTLAGLNRYEEAIAHFDKALSLRADIDWIYGDLVHTKMKICDWSGFSDSSENIYKKVMADEKVVQTFSLLSLSDNPLLHKKAAEIFIRSKIPSNQVLGPLIKRPKNQKIRIGYFSADFRNHPVSLLIAELIELHNKNKFEVIAFSFGEDDKSPLRLRLSEAFNKFIDVRAMSDQQIAELARELEIDIAIDLGGLTSGARMGIFSHCAAPIQVNWLGYPGTTGLDHIDYIVSDKTIIPETHQKFYNEKVVYLPDTYMVDDSKRIASSRKYSRAECGLPENAFVFCCFNNHYKFNPQVLDSWSRVLRSVAGSVLWISENNNKFKENILIEFERRGIYSSRIIFAQRVELMADHLSRIALADIFLDTHPYNAHSTALDSLKAGVPILTLMGNSFASRVSASLLNAIGLSELITNDQGQYENLAIELATNPEKLSELKKKLSRNTDAIKYQ
jgi:predicted O-linked N-acetylglucosamine transferase (SPINDLY family)